MSVDFFASHHNVELQQRAIEFSSLFSRHDNLRAGLFEKMPPIPRRKDLFNSEAQEEETAAAYSRRPAHETNAANSSPNPASKVQNQSITSGADELLGLDLGNMSSPGPMTANTSSTGDALLDLLCLEESLPTTGTPSSNPTLMPSTMAPQTTTSTAGSNVLDLLDL